MSLLENGLGQEVSHEGAESYGLSKEELRSLVLELGMPTPDTEKCTCFELLKIYRQLKFPQGDTVSAIQRCLPAFHYCANLKDTSYSKHSSWINSEDVVAQSIEEGERAFCFITPDGKVTLLKRFRKVSLQLEWEEEVFWLPCRGDVRLVFDVMYDRDKHTVCLLDVVGTEDNPTCFTELPWAKRQEMLDRLIMPTQWAAHFTRPSHCPVVELEDVSKGWEARGKQGFILKNKNGVYKIDNKRGGVKSADTWFRSKFGQAMEPTEKPVYEKAFIRSMLRDGYGRVVGVELAVLDGVTWKTIGAALNVSKKLCLLWENDRKAFDKDYYKAVCKVHKDEQGGYVVDKLTGSKDIIETQLKK